MNTVPYNTVRYEQCHIKIFTEMETATDIIKLTY